MGAWRPVVLVSNDSGCLLCCMCWAGLGSVTEGFTAVEVLREDDGWTGHRSVDFSPQIHCDCKVCVYQACCVFHMLANKSYAAALVLPAVLVLLCSVA